MKRLSIALLAATLALSGCGLFGTHHAWKEAQQENPLQIPPGMDRPSTTDALTIPPPGSPQTASEAQQTTSIAANATSMHLQSDVETAWKRIGVVLQRGDLGTVAAQDEAQHTYRLSITSKAVLGNSQSFLQKHFSNLNQQPANASGAPADDSAGGGAVVDVMLSVTPAKGGGSTVSASGDPQQAVRVISVLNSRLGG